MADTFKDWLPGDPKYSAGTIAGNFRAIRKQISDLLSTGGRDVIVSMQQVGRALTFRTAAGLTLTGATLPLAPTTPKGTRVPGRFYAEGDTYVAAGSSYVALIGHNAAPSLSADLAANKVTLLAAAGADAENFAGQYTPGQAYAGRDVVYAGDPVAGPVSYYRAFLDVPAGVAPPSFPWGLIATYQRDVLRGFSSGPLGANRRIWAGIGTVPCYLPFGLSGTRLVLGTAAAAALTLSIRRNGVEVATATFAAGATVATVSASGTVALGATDVLSVHAPASADAAAADLSVAFLTMPQA